ncbi:WD domain [Entamoeba marina]
MMALYSMWMPFQTQNQFIRLVGHSRSNRIISSSGCDKNIRIWDGFTGSCLHTYRGHVQTVYDTVGHLIVELRKLISNLPGHLDEVFSGDWSLDGSSVATTSYDHTIKIWRY